MRTKLVLVVAVCVAAGLLAWHFLANRTNEPRASSVTHGETAAPSGSVAPSTDHVAATPAAGHVRRLSAEDRRQLGEQIAAAVHRARSTTVPGAAGRASSGADDGEDLVIRLEEVSKPLQQALAEATPLMAECYQKYARTGSSASTAVAMMTMASDPDLGTVIDTDKIAGSDGQPLDREVDDCMRDTIDRLALPPLGKTGKLQLQYSFRFDQ